MSNAALGQCVGRNLQQPLTGNWRHLFMASSKSGFNPVRIIMRQPRHLGEFPLQDNEDPV